MMRHETVSRVVSVLGGARALSTLGWASAGLLGALCACERSDARAPEMTPARPVPASQAEALTSTLEISVAPPPAVPLLPSAPTVSEAQREAYEARRAKSVLEAQLYRNTSNIDYLTSSGRSGTATFVDLAPTVQVWSLLTLAWSDGQIETWHLENPSGLSQWLSLDPSVPTGLMLRRGGQDIPCDLWGGEPSALQLARETGAAYASLCGGALALRNATVGSRTRLEWTTDFLRDNVWGGEALTNLVKETFYVDAELQTAELADGLAAVSHPSEGPVAALVAPDVAGRLLSPVSLGLSVDGATGDLLEVGAWYPVHAVPGAWVSLLQPRFIEPSIPARAAPWSNTLDATEGGALVYTVAFDLANFDLGFEVGTDHPRVGWGDSVPAASRAPGLPGPDGYDDLAPLARTGTLDPAYISRLVGVFVGGFRRAHGAMRTGELSARNGGSHYGFVEFGTELSRLQPGLATLVVWLDQTVELRTWTEADASRLWMVRHARQNGVPLVETDAVSGEIRPGALVDDWRMGNWSGSVEGTLRSVRGGVCIQESAEGRFLLYSYFSSATPSAMAQVYMAYQCGYAMLLDMNALEHTYLALHVHEGEALTVEQLVQGMGVLDRQKGGETYPRFVGYADNRDFFYLLRK